MGQHNFQSHTATILRDPCLNLEIKFKLLVYCSFLNTYIAKYCQYNKKIFSVLPADPCFENTANFIFIIVCYDLAYLRACVKGFSSLSDSFRTMSELGRGVGECSRSSGSERLWESIDGL